MKAILLFCFVAVLSCHAAHAEPFYTWEFSGTVDCGIPNRCLWLDGTSLDFHLYTFSVSLDALSPDITSETDRGEWRVEFNLQFIDLGCDPVHLSMCTDFGRRGVGTTRFGRMQQTSGPNSFMGQLFFADKIESLEADGFGIEVFLPLGTFPDVNLLTPFPTVQAVDGTPPGVTQRGAQPGNTDQPESSANPQHDADGADLRRVR